MRPGTTVSNKTACAAQQSTTGQGLTWDTDVLGSGRAWHTHETGGMRVAGAEGPWGLHGRDGLGLWPSPFRRR